jgi:hypothetical protein
MDWILSSAYAYPALEATHIVGIALLLGSLVVFELRIWGAGTAVAPEHLARLALPVTLAGFGLAAASGGLMFASQYDELLANRAFLVKMALLVVAGLNAALFHWRGGSGRHDAWARSQTALSLGLWVAVIVCGRWIAYV